MYTKASHKTVQKYAHFLSSNGRRPDYVRRGNPHQYERDIHFLHVFNSRSLLKKYNLLLSACLPNLREPLCWRSVLKRRSFAKERAALPVVGRHRWRSSHSHGELFFLVVEIRVESDQLKLKSHRPSSRVP